MKPEVVDTNTGPHLDSAGAQWQGIGAN